MARPALRRVVLLGSLAVALGVAIPSLYAAIWTDAEGNGANAFTTDTLNPPSGLGASGGTCSIALNWTATPDTYAAGHRVLRSTTSGGPYSQIAQVTPRTTTTYTDLPAAGTYYYVGRAFYQNWESGNSGEAVATEGGSETTGFRSPTAEAADTGGDSDGFELNPTDAFADAAAFASNIDGAGDRHRFSGYGIAIGSNCAIEGIEVRLDWWLDEDKQINSMDVELSWNGGASWTAAKTDPVETTTEHTAILGSASDTWGRTWTLAELNDANFRVRVTSLCTVGPGQCDIRDYFLDWVAVQVTYAAQ